MCASALSKLGTHPIASVPSIIDCNSLYCQVSERCTTAAATRSLAAVAQSSHFTMAGTFPPLCIRSPRWYPSESSSVLRCSHFPEGAAYHGYDVEAGVLREEAVEVLRLFYSRGNAKAPRPQRPLAPSDDRTVSYDGSGEATGPPEATLHGASGADEVASESALKRAKVDVSAEAADDMK